MDAAPAGRAVRAGRGAGRVRRRYAVAAPREVFGLRFPNPVGLAAGMDKNGRRAARLAGLGLRLRRGRHGDRAGPAGQRPAADVPAAGSRGGDQPDGLQQRRRARRWPPGCAALGPLPVPLGISLGKSKVTPLEDAVEDYVASLRALLPVRRLLRRQRQLAEHARAARLAGPGAARRPAHGAACRGAGRPPDRATPAWRGRSRSW